MRLIDTIPIYGSPEWIGYTVLICIVLVIINMIIGVHCVEKKWPIITLIITGSITLLLCLFIATGAFSTHLRDEYVVELTEIRASDFLKEFEPVKTFEYSDAIQVRKKGDN